MPSSLSFAAYLFLLLHLAYFGISGSYRVKAHDK